MLKKTTLAVVFLIAVFALSSVAMARAPYIPLAKFGISTVSDVYSKYREGRTFDGKVTDPASVGDGNLFDTAYQGEKLKITHLGNGQVRIQKVASDDEILLDARLLKSVPVN